MKDFLLRFAVVLTFTLVLLGGLEYYIRVKDDTKMALKRDFLLDNADRLEGIAFGSSHLWRGLDASRLTPFSHNLGLTAGDLYAATYIADWALERSQPKFIIIELLPPYLEHLRQEEWYEKRRIYYYYGFKRGRVTIKDHFLLRHPAYRILLYALREETYDARGFSTSMNPRQDYFRLDNYNEDSIAVHPYTLRHTQDHNELRDEEAYAINTALLRQLVAKCRDRNITVIFLDLPKHHTYNNAVNPELVARRARFLDSVVDGTSVRWWDMSRFGERETRWFYNFTHLNVAGAHAFTDSLDRRLVVEGVFEKEGG